MGSCLLKGGHSLFIHRAQEEDAADLLSFLQKAACESDTLLTAPGEFSFTVEQEREFLRAAAESEKDMYLCGRIEGQLCAVASYTGGSHKRDAHTAELSVVVGKKYWNMGAGTSLLKALVEHAAQSGRFSLLHLCVREDNEGAVHTYKKLGFVSMGRLPAYFYVNDVYYDAILMCLPLTDEVKLKF